MTNFLLVFHPDWDIGLSINVVVHVLHALTVIVPVLGLRVVFFGPVLDLQHMHPAKDHHHSHHDYHDSGYDFASLITHITSLLYGPVG